MSNNVDLQDNRIEDMNNSRNLLEKTHSNNIQLKTMNNRSNKSHYSFKLIAKILILISIFCIILLTLLSLTAIGLFKTYKTLHNLKNEKYLSHNNKNLNLECETSACYKASNFILNNLNQTINPCEDFYQFTCGNWLEKNENEEKDHFTMAYEKMLQDISDILKTDISTKNESRLVSNFKLYYQSCLNQSDVEFNSDRDFLEVLSKELGPWPLVPNLNKGKADYKDSARFLSDTRFGIEEYIFRLKYLGTPLLFRFESNDFNHTKIIMQLVVTADFCLIQNFLPNHFSHNHTRIKKEFLKLMKSIRNYMFESQNDGLDFNTAVETRNSSIYEVNLDEQVDEMIQLANQIYLINDSNYNCNRKSGTSQKRVNNVLTIEELDQKLNVNLTKKNFDFMKFIDYFNRNANKTILSKKSEVFITSRTLKFLLDLFNGLDKNLLNFTDTKFRRAFVNLAYFNAIFSLIKPLELFSQPHIHLKLPIRYYHAFFEYSKHINNITPIDNFKSIYRINREQNCAYTVIEIFSVTDSFEQAELQRLFLRKALDPNVKNYTNEILSNLKETTFDLIDELKWIDLNLKEKIKTGIRDIEFKIVYSDSLFDDLTISNHDNDINKNVHYNLTNSYIKNIFLIKKKNHDKEFDLLDIQQIKRIRNKKYVFDIFLANLMYLKQYNTLIMPAGILVDPIFNLENPVYLNYATIGAYLAHEIWHMIDEEIIKSESARKAYELKLICLRDNYARFVNEKYGYEIEGYASISEQISDNFGVIVSLKSYLKLIKETSKINNQLLPGITMFNQKQLFLIRYAMSFCRKNKSTKKQLDDFEQFHVVHEFRAFQVKLMPEFYDIFECKMPDHESNHLKPCYIF